MCRASGRSPLEIPAYLPSRPHAAMRTVTETVLINGAPGGSIEVGDRGLHYGDGLFETMAVHAGTVPHWARHLQRLRRGCERLGLPCPDGDRLQDEAQRLCARQQRAVLKLILTRGPGGRGYRPPEVPAPTRILSLHPWPDYPAGYRTEGVAVRWCTTRLGSNPGLAGIKHLNRLEQVLARAEWEDAACAEGLMLDQQGRVVCGTMSNMFWVQAGVLYTPPIDDCGVAGVTRERVLECAQGQGQRCRQERVLPEDLSRADEVFLCNSLIGIWPVARLEGQRWQPGPVTARLASTLDLP